MSHLTWGTKHPTDIDWFSIDWTDPVGTTDDGQATNDSIETVEWILPTSGGSPAVPLLTQAATLQTGYETRIKLGGGVAGGYYNIFCKITTNQGRTLTRSGFLIVTTEG